MKNATTIADVSNLEQTDVFDLEAAYVDTVASKPRDDRRGIFHPSAVGMCGRRNVYEYIKAPAITTIEPESLEIFDMGHAVHAIVQGKLGEVESNLEKRDIKYTFREEVPYDKKTDVLFHEYGIGGTADGILDIWVPDKWHQRGVIEIKSINDANFNKLKGPKKEHIEQATVYAYRFDCPIIWSWYYNKNNSRRRVFTTLFDQEILDGVLDRYDGWLKHASDGTLPPREESWFMCPRCEYRDECQPSSVRKKRAKDYNKRISEGRKRGRLRRL